MEGGRRGEEREGEEEEERGLPRKKGEGGVCVCERGNKRRRDEEVRRKRRGKG